MNEKVRSDSLSGEDEARGKKPLQRFHEGLGLGLMLGLLFSMNGCSSDSSPDWADIKGEAGPSKLVEFSQTARFEERWHREVGDSGLNQLMPALTADSVYAASA